VKKLAKVLDRESYEWLTSHQPDIVDAIESEVDDGNAPGDIKLMVLRMTQRQELALRCYMAARHYKRVSER
jgi:hypothetical protein